MRIQIKTGPTKYDQISIISTSGISRSLEGFYLQFNELDSSVTIRADNVLTVLQGERVNLVDLFEHPTIEAGGTNQPASREITVESEDVDSTVQLRKADEVVDEANI